ncbi:DUF505 domain-containing protein [Hydrogenimonas sp.]
MVIKKEEARHLLALLDAPKREIDVSKLNEESLLVLELSGLTAYPTPGFVTLTYGGEMVARALGSLVENHAVDAIEKWNSGFRWIGSEILAMMEDSKKSGNVSEISREALEERGLAVKVHDKERKIDTIVLSEAAEDVLRAFECIEPEIKIDSELAHLILTSPEGPTEAIHLPFDDSQKELLESMRLLAYSIPKGDIAAFTGLGRAVKRVLEYGAAASEGDVIDTTIMDLLANLVDGEEITEEAKVQLQMMGYIDDEMNLLPAGEALMALRAMLKNPVERRLFSFAVSKEELETLEVVGKLGEARPEDIKKEMIDKKVKEYKKLLEEYGRRLDEMPLKKRQILEQFQDMKEHEKWFESNFDIREYLYSLEAFDLVEAGKDEKGKECFVLTENGQKVKEERKSHGNASLSSKAVKTVKLHKRPFAVANREWVENARKEGVLGEYGPGPVGEFYEALSETIERKPFMTRYEMDIFKMIPSRGMTESELLENAKNEHDEEMMRSALDALEARGFVEILSDGHIVETTAGELMDRALSGVPEGFGAPVTPVIYRVLKAVAEVGTLYEKEKKIRIMPKQHKEAYELSGLSPETFEKAWVAAREARYLGKNGVNEAGLDLLRAVAAMNP